MTIPIFIRKHGPEQQQDKTFDKVKLRALAELVRETATHAVFLSQEYLGVDLHSHYYAKRKSPAGKLELWLIEFPAATEMQPPYTYTAANIEKYRDVSEDWIQDE